MSTLDDGRTPEQVINAISESVSPKDNSYDTKNVEGALVV
jgi:hypothetical protein